MSRVLLFAPASIALVALWVSVPSGHAQATQPARPTAPESPAAHAAVSTLSSTTSLVVVPALIRKKAGQVVYTLHADDFALTDDGIPQTLHLEQDTGGEPLALVVVIEADAATRAAGWHPYTHTGPSDRFHGVPAMVEAMAAGVPHQVAVVGFDSQPELELPFTSNFDTVADTIQQLDHGNSGDHGAGILDALVFAVDLLRGVPPGYRRAILLLSETNDRGSRATFETTLRSITETNTAIYAVAFSTPLHQASEYGNKQLPTKALSFQDTVIRKNAGAAGKLLPANPAEEIAQRILQGAMFGITLENAYPSPPNGCMGADPAADPSGAPLPFHEHLSQAFNCLAQLAPPLAIARMAMIAAVDITRRNVPMAVAHLTGGEYFPFRNARTLEDALATLANHVPNRYVFSFQPQTPHPGVHVLSLTLKQYPQLQVNARTTYWAQPTPDP